MSVYQRPPRPDELYHWGKGMTAGVHKYIAKIGNRYFYTPEELKAFKDGVRGGIQNGLHSFDKSRQAAINKVGGARDRVAAALRGANERAYGALGGNAKKHYRNAEQRRQVTAYNAKQAERRADESEARAKRAKVDADYNKVAWNKRNQVRLNQAATNNAKVAYERKMERNQARTAASNASRSAAKAKSDYERSLVGRIDRLRGKAGEAAEAATKSVINNRVTARANSKNKATQSPKHPEGYWEQVAEAGRKITRQKKVASNNANSRAGREDSRSQQSGQTSTAADRVKRNANIAGRNLGKAVTDARNEIASGVNSDIIQPAKETKKRVTNTASKAKSNAQQAGRNLNDAVHDARDEVSRGIQNDLVRPVSNAKKKTVKTAKKIQSNAQEAGHNLREAGRSFVEAYNSDMDRLRKRRKRR